MAKKRSLKAGKSATKSATTARVVLRTKGNPKHFTRRQAAAVVAMVLSQPARSGSGVDQR